MLVGCKQLIPPLQVYAFLSAGNFPRRKRRLQAFEERWEWETKKIETQRFLFLCVFITTVLLDESLPPSSLVGEKPKELRCCSSKLKPNHRWKSSRKSLACEKLWRLFLLIIAEVSRQVFHWIHYDPKKVFMFCISDMVWCFMGQSIHMVV